jgi:ABC-2 type transport system permease protein
MTAVVPLRPAGGLSAGVVEILTVAGRRLRHLRRAVGRFIGIVLNPILSMVVFGFLFRQSIVVPGSVSYQDYLFAGVAIQTGLASVGATATGVALDLRGGMVDRMRSLPISRPSALAGHTVADLVMALLALAVVTVVGMLLGWRPHGGFVATLAGFALLVVFMYAMIWVGVVLGLTTKAIESIGPTATLITVVLPFLSNAFLLVDNLPGVLRPIVEWNPVSALATACRELWGTPAAAGSSFPAQNPIVVVAITLGVTLALCMLFGVRRYRTAAN